MTMPKSTSTTITMTLAELNALVNIISEGWASLDDKEQLTVQEGKPAGIASARRAVAKLMRARQELES